MALLDTVSKGRQGRRKEVQKGGRNGMARNERRYPISEEQFNKEVLPIMLSVQSKAK